MTLNVHKNTVMGTALCDSKRTWELEMIRIGIGEFMIVGRKDGKLFRIIRTDNGADAMRMFTETKTRMSIDFDK